MASESGGPLLAFIRHIAGSCPHSELTDGELLQRFAAQREEAAFTALLHRHGPMVLGVCQSILQDVHDAEDAFQATFLVLVRKPKAIGKPTSIASWLHGVAYRLAMKARTEAARRRSCERQVVTMPTGEPQDEVIWRDLQPVLHQEVDRLPQRYRLPFVLCYLEGKTNEEAADLLGWPRGTVLSSLSRARERLRQRLTRRGLGLTSGLLAAFFAQNTVQAAVPAPLAESTLQAALLFATGTRSIGGIAAPVLAYAEGMLHASLMAKLKLTAVILLTFAAVGVGASVLVYRVRDPVQAPVSPKLQSPEHTVEENPTAVTPASQPLMPDKDRLQGAWIITAAQQHGRGVDGLKDRRLVFVDDRFTLSRGEGEVRGIIRTAQMEGTFDLELANPKRIDLIEGNWHLQGIYSLDEKTLTICVSEVNQGERPVEFTTKPGSSELLLFLSRQ
jgi:RNA polymerase sigma factor (sigma-70 family)